jgi:hypothetical protein
MSCTIKLVKQATDSFKIHLYVGRCLLLRIHSESNFDHFAFFQIGYLTNHSTTFNRLCHSGILIHPEVSHSFFGEFMFRNLKSILFLRIRYQNTYLTKPYYGFQPIFSFWNWSHSEVFFSRVWRVLFSGYFKSMSFPRLRYQNTCFLWSVILEMGFLWSG